MKPFSETAKENLLVSLQYSADFLEKNASRTDGAAVFGETAVQLIRGYYLYRIGNFLTGGVGDAIDELGLDFSREDKELLTGIEKAMRMEEDYRETVLTLKPEITSKIALRLREALK
jgi:hypothetical protein